MFSFFKSGKKDSGDSEKKMNKEEVFEKFPLTGYHKEYHTQWDENNRPTTYIIGVTPGFAEFAQGEQKLAESGLARKIMKGARFGFDFIEIDFETISEINEYHLREYIKRVKEAQGVEIGVHGPVAGGRASIPLDLGVATAPHWEINHRNLQRTAYASGEICQAKFIIFHTSHAPRPRVSHAVGGENYQGYHGPQFSFTGEVLGKWIEDVDEQAGNGGYRDPCYTDYHKLPPLKFRTDTKYGDSFSLKAWFISKNLDTLYRVISSTPDLNLADLYDYPGKPENVELIEKLGLDKTNYYKYKELLKKIKEYMTNREDEKIEELKKSINSSLEEVSNNLKKLNDKIKAENRNPTPDEEKLINNYMGAINHYSGLLQDSEGLRERARGNLINNDKFYKKVFELYRGMQARESNLDLLYDHWRARGSEAEESVSYHVTAKFMYMTKDPLWMNIVGNVDPDDIVDAGDLGMDKVPGTDKTFSLMIEKYMAAVAAKYIQGHLFVKGEWVMGTLPDYQAWKKRVNEDISENYYLSVYEYAEKYKVILLAETEQAPAGQEGKLRIMNAKDHIHMVRISSNPTNSSNLGFFAYNMDYEHLTTNLINPIQDAQSLDEGDGKYVLMLHTNAPRPYGGAHAPMYIHSEDMYVIYKWMYELRKKGVEGAYIIWEMGSYGVQQSAIAFRSLVKELKKGTPPEELPKEFFGLDDKFEAIQKITVLNHAFDPLDRMMTFTSEKHTFLKKHALEKNKITDWQREEFS